MPSENLIVEPLSGTDSNKHLYRLQGPLVLGTMLAIQDLLSPAPVSTILDMREVPMVDSAGLGALVNCYVSRQKVGRKLLLVGVNDRLATLLKITRLQHLFEVFPTVEDAVRFLESHQA